MEDLEIIVSDDFLRELEKRTDRERVLEKVSFLRENRFHPGLSVHKIKGTRDKWELYVTDSDRIIYDFKDGFLRLWKLGDHRIIDRVGNFSFSPHTTFRRYDKPVQEQEEVFKIPAEWTEPVVERSYPFQFFPASHLRLLGVPAGLVKAVQCAPSMEDLEKVFGLSERTRNWLFDIYTNPDMEEVITNPGRFLFRTTLDRLEGYCQGTIKKLMLNLGEEQQKYVSLQRNGSFILKGCAGSGKTTVGIYRAIHKAQEGNKVFLVTFSKRLNAVTRDLIEELIGPLPDNLIIQNYHRWEHVFYRLRFGENPNIVSNHQKMIFLQKALEKAKGQKKKDKPKILLQSWRFFRDEIARIINGCGLQKLEEYLKVMRYGRKTALGPESRIWVWKVYEYYHEMLREEGLLDWEEVAIEVRDELNRRPLVEKFDDVIVDEGQDLTPVQLQVLGKLPSQEGSFWCLVDASQTIYSRGFAWKQAGIEARGRTGVIRRNYRNTRPIAQAAHALASHNSLLRQEGEYIDPELSKRTGPPPVLLCCDVPDREYTAVSETIMDLIADQQFRPADFAVLAPRREIVEKARQVLEAKHLPATTLAQEEGIDLLEERIKVLTIQSAKGLEFPVVFILGVHEGIFPPQRGYEEEEEQMEQERSRTLLYVAMTRAAEGLFLLTSSGRESPFLAEFREHLREENYSGGTQFIF